MKKKVEITIPDCANCKRLITECECGKRSLK